MFELKEIECPHCSGYGYMESEIEGGEIEDCPECGGTGMIAVERSLHGFTTE